MAFEVEDLKQKGLYVEVHNNDVYRALRKLKKSIQGEGIFQTLREREFYQSKGEKRKKAKARAVKRWQKKNREMKEFYG
jgi:small subunit ribosomal protein S21